MAGLDTSYDDIIQTWHHVKIPVGKPRGFSINEWIQDHPDFPTWLSESTTGYYYWTYDTSVWFENSDDVMLFQLTWL